MSSAVTDAPAAKQQKLNSDQAKKVIVLISANSMTMKNHGLSNQRCNRDSLHLNPHCLYDWIGAGFPDSF